QAEDGIRDATVTGVQTCALPIFNCSIPVGLAGAGRALPFSSVRERVRAVRQPRGTAEARHTRTYPPCSSPRCVGARLITKCGREIGRASCRERVWVEVGGERGGR